jgi:hypothetical protein
MKTGSSLGDPFVDCGAICMGPRQMLAYQRLIDDAVSKGIYFYFVADIYFYQQYFTGAEVS